MKIKDAFYTHIHTRAYLEHISVLVFSLGSGQGVCWVLLGVRRRHSRQGRRMRNLIFFRWVCFPHFSYVCRYCRRLRVCVYVHSTESSLCERKREWERAIDYL